VATDRRFTGSVPKEKLLVTSWIDDGIQRIDQQDWTVRVGPASFDLPGLLALPQERISAVLDCTSGWYSAQQWEGVRLSTLLDEAALGPGWRSLEVRSTTGYARWFGPETVDHLWLVTAVGGSPLTYGHGYPARLVAPGRRGFWWVKWVTSIQPSARPPWAQSVFPLT
jgi:DMSO/TMAO reductase YedYZ molybdopterin-dependent catalytic subunit